MNEKIAAVVVTYNRKELLLRCCSALLAQSYSLDKIFIVDNYSTDGTFYALEQRGYISNSKIQYVGLEANSGGAGGFYEGMKRAFEAGYDWLWLMDDDGYPDSDCLAKQLETKDSLEVIGSTVVLPEDSTKLTWTLLCYDRCGYFSPWKRVVSREQLSEESHENIYFGYGIFFNAILIHRSVIERVGFVNSDMFIRGDEFEYFLRCRKKKIRIGTHIQALYYHPYQDFQTNNWKFFYAFRNLFYNYTQYSQVTYSRVILTFYLGFNFIKYLTLSPSFKLSYLAHVLNAVRLATQGFLLPYQAVEMSQTPDCSDSASRI